MAIVGLEERKAELTYADACLVPVNLVELQVLYLAEQKECEELYRLRNQFNNALRKSQDAWEKPIQYQGESNEETFAKLTDQVIELTEEISDFKASRKGGKKKKSESLVSQRLTDFWERIRGDERGINLPAAVKLISEVRATLYAKIARDLNERHWSYVMKLAQKYNVGNSISRDAVDYSGPDDGFGAPLPIVIANMETIVGRKRMPEIMARLGAAAAISQDKSDKELRESAQYLHSRHPLYTTPVMLNPDSTVKNFRDCIGMRDMTTAVVVGKAGKFLGVLHQHDIPDGTGKDEKIKELMKPKEKAVTVKEGISAEEALDVFEDHPGIKLLPVLKPDGTVAGVITRKSLMYFLLYKPHLDEENGGFPMLTTISALNQNPVQRAKLLIRLGVRGIILDTANLDQGTKGYENIRKVRKLIDASGKNITLIAGNVVTGDATRRAIAAGADIVKVGVGPGKLCKTRMVTGVGRPQLSAILECARVARALGKHIWADGGVEHPRDVALALAAGASRVMIGTIFTATYESPEDFLEDQFGLYKFSAGMASRRSSALRNSRKKGGVSREEKRRAFIRRERGDRSEGVVGRIRMMKDEEGRELKSAADILDWLIQGSTSMTTYEGEEETRNVPDNADMRVQTPSGYQEGRPRV